MFSDLKKGFQVHTLDTNTVPKYELGRVVAVSEPRYLPPQPGQYQTMQTRVVDLTVELTGETKTYTVPESQNVAKAMGITLSTSIDPIMNELNAIKNTSQEIIDSVDTHRAKIEACESILEEVNPAFKQTREQDRKIAGIENKVNDLTDSFEDLKKLIVERLKTVGIDLGLKSFATLSDGIVIDNIKFFREKQSEIAKIQRHLSRKSKGSNRHRKNKIKIARLYNKIANRRNNFLHNVTTSLVNNYDVICIEDLNVSGMLSNHKLAKAISDTSFSMFRSMLEYKCNWYGKELVVIDRFYPSSKTCSKCGWKKEDLTLSDRVFKCENCSIEIDRDLNAAINIQRVGVDILYNRMQRDEVTNLNEASIME